MIKKTMYVLAFAALFLGAFILWAVSRAPSAHNIQSCITTTMNSILLCPQNPDYVPLSQISDELIHAIVISEDAAFFGHEGFDWKELKKSVEQNIEKGRFARGGSTITQQLAKNVYLSTEKSITRKIKEAYLAYQIEQSLSKRKILEKYLNVIQLGQSIYGVKQAAQFYFQKEPSQINFMEAAYLAYLLPSPANYSKVFKEQKLTDYARRTILNIIRKMKNFRKISEQDYNYAQEQIDHFPWSIKVHTTDLHSDNSVSDDAEDESLSVIDESAVDDTPSMDDDDEQSQPSYETLEKEL